MTLTAEQQQQLLKQMEMAYKALEKMEARLEQSEASRHEPLAVIGTGCRFPGGAEDPTRFWKMLLEGVDVIDEVPKERWDADRFYDPDPDTAGKIITRRGGFLDKVYDFDPRYFNITPKEAESLDPQHRLLLEVHVQALEDAGLPIRSLQGGSVAVFTGLSTFDYAAMQFARRRYEDIDPYFITGSFPSMAAGRIAYTFGFNGPAMTVDTACSSALVSLHLACRALRSGEADLALASGVNLMLSPEVSINFSKTRMLSPDGACKTFDAAADGYVRGEGCAVFVLKRLSDAERDGDRITAVIRGTALRHDGVSAGITVPNGKAQEAVIAQALKDAQLKPEDIGYIECHGTGTSLGDPLEVEALGRIFGKERKHPLILGAVKTNLGHTEAAAGAAGLLKALLVVREGKIPANLHFHNPNPKIPWNLCPFHLPAEVETWDAEQRIAGISSFGASGTNAHAVVARYQAKSSGQNGADQVPQAEEPRLLTLSAKSDAALKQVAGDLAEHLQNNQNYTLADICAALTYSRDHHGHRAAAVFPAETHPLDIAADLAAFSMDGKHPFQKGKSEGNPRLVLLFTGQGSQWPGMGKTLYEHNPTFRQTLDQCDHYLRDHLEHALIDVMFARNGIDPKLIHDTGYAQPAIFALEIAAYRILEKLGIKAAALVGHSVGEISAACAAGVFSLEDGLKLIAARGKLMSALPSGGGMLVALGDPEKVRAAVAEHSQTVSIAAYNGPTNTVVSGGLAQLEQIATHLKSQGLQTINMTVSHAFHSPLMDPMLEPFAEVVKTIVMKPAKLPLLAEGVFAGDQITKPRFWVDHVREPVQFNKAMETLEKRGFRTFLELGPKPILSGMAKRCLAEPKQVAWYHFHDDRGGSERLEQLPAFLYSQGFQCFPALHQQNRPIVPLPHYPFQRKTFRIAMSAEKVGLTGGAEQAGRIMLGTRLPLADSGKQHFHTRLSPNQPIFLADHVIHETVITPGSAYVETAFAASEALGGDYALENLEIGRPMIFAENAAKHVQTVLEPQDDDRYGFKIYSSADEQGPWDEHCAGTLVAFEKPEVEPLADAQERCRDTFDIQRLYRQYRHSGLQLGDSFTRVLEVRLGKGESLGHIRLPEKLQPEAGRFCFHPALLDACFQVAGPMFLSLLDHNNYLPVGIQKAYSYRTYGPDLFCRAKLASPYQEGDKPETLDVDFTIYNGEGQVVAVIQGLRFRKTDRNAVRRGLQGEMDKHLYQIQWTTDFNLEETDQAGPSKLIIGNNQTAKALVTRFRADNIQTIHIQAGEQNPVEELHQAVTAAGSGPFHVLYIADQYADQTASHQVLALIQALLANKVEVTGLTIITQGAVDVDGRCPNPQQATLWGMAASLAVEHPEFKPLCIDRDPDADDTLDLLIHTSAGNPRREDQLAIRNGKIYAPRLAALRAVEKESPFTVNPEASYLITGGYGGIGLQLAQFLVARGARNLILVGRRGPNPVAEKQLAALTEAGARIHHVQADIADQAAVKQMFMDIAEIMPVLKGIFHTAGILDDHPLRNAQWEHFQRAFAAKIQGTENLHKGSLGLPLDAFVLFASVAPVIGSYGQANYAAANAYLDSFAAHRRQQGLTALAVDWGAWSGSGMAAEVSPEVRASWRESGIQLLNPDRALKQLERLLNLDLSRAVAVEIAWSTFLQKRYRGSGPNRFAELGPKAGGQSKGLGRAKQQFRDTSADQRKTFLATYLRKLIAEIMSLEDADALGDREPLFDAGLDSLMAVDMRGKLENAFDVELGSTLLFDYPTIEALTGRLLDLLGNAEGGGQTIGQSAAGDTRRAVSSFNRYQPLPDLDDNLDDAELETLLEAELQAIEDEKHV